jgi:protein O-GlcNAc transferase
MRYLFISGCGHSGTSLLLSIFAYAKGVYAIPYETNHLLTNSLDSFKKVFTPEIDLEEPKRLIVEKTPNHVFSLDSILNDDQCTGLVMVRNPVDTIASLKKRGYPVFKAIDRYLRANLEWIKRADSEKMVVLKYESLVNETHETLSELSTLFGVDLNEAVNRRRSNAIKFFNTQDPKPTDGCGEKAHVSLRAHQMSQPIVNMNGDWNTRLTRDELSAIQSATEPLIRFMGYSDCLEYNLMETAK